MQRIGLLKLTRLPEGAVRLHEGIRSPEHALGRVLFYQQNKYCAAVSKLNFSSLLLTLGRLEQSVTWIS
jgi:hypothetical protein